LARAKGIFLASELGEVSATIGLAVLFDESDPQRWRWWDRAFGCFWNFLTNFSKQVYCKTSNRILRDADQSTESCDACMDSS
jgi:hypothetical protein